MKRFDNRFACLVIPEKIEKLHSGRSKKSSHESSNSKLQDVFESKWYMEQDGIWLNTNGLSIFLKQNFIE